MSGKPDAPDEPGSNESEASDEELSDDDLDAAAGGGGYKVANQLKVPKPTLNLPKTGVKPIVNPTVQMEEEEEAVQAHDALKNPGFKK